MSRLPRRPNSSRSPSAWTASLALHLALVLLAPGIAYFASSAPARRPFQVAVAQRPEPAPAFEERPRAEEPHELELEAPPDPAVVEAEFEPVPLLALERAAAAATVAVPFEPRLDSIRFGAARALAARAPSGTGAEALGTPPPADGPTAPSAAGSVGSAAVARSTPQPEYPPLSRSRGEQGTVTLRISVDDHGGVAHVEIVESSGFRRLDEAALAGVRKWRFDPATEANGATVDSEVLWKVVFELKSA